MAEMQVRAIAKGEWESKAGHRTRKSNPVFAGLIEMVQKHGGAVIEGVETPQAAKTLQSSLAAVGRRAGFPLTSSYNAAEKILLVVKREA